MVIKIPEKYNGVKENVRDSVAFMGLSLGKPLFSNKNVIENYISFLHENFAVSYLLIADTPKRHNVMALEGIDEKEAIKRIVITSRDAKIFLEKLASKYLNIHVISWNEYADENYRHNLSILTRKYCEDQQFREDCNKEVRKFLLIPSNTEKLYRINSTLEQGTKVASKYHLEELAMLLSFPIALGKKVCEIYPGINKVQEKLQNGEYSFCSELRKNPNRLFMEVYYE